MMKLPHQAQHEGGRLRMQSQRCLQAQTDATRLGCQGLSTDTDHAMRHCIRHQLTNVSSRVGEQQ